MHLLEMLIIEQLHLLCALTYCAITLCASFLLLVRQEHKTYLAIGCANDRLLSCLEGPLSDPADRGLICRPEASVLTK